MSSRQGFKFVPQLLNVDRNKGQKVKRKKFTLVFDEEKRKEFLTGFRKRKLQRIQKAKEEFEAQCKEEKKRIRREAKENLKKLVSQRDIPELEELVAQTEHKYEMQGKTVSILELDVNQLRQSDNWIGENKPTYEKDVIDNDDSDDEESTTVPGMELKTKPKFVEEQSDGLHLTKKELSRVVQKETLQKMKKNVIFQRKQKILRSKNRKMAIREKIRKERLSERVKGRPVKGKKKNKKSSRSKE
ncbi:GSCOCG00009777001-RA-CDS [Cotesia congregata]|nr:GSCOCG00009777001-RA-CDS [Cotesia congregata]